MNKGYSTTSPIPFDVARKICHDLLKSKDWKFGLYWAIGIYTALRISDILNIKWEDLRENKLRMAVKEKKTRKFRIIKVNKALSAIIESMPIEGKRGYVFSTNGSKPYDPSGVNRKIKRTLAQYGQPHKYESSHSLRKTFSTELYKKTGDLWLVCKVLNHSNPTITMRYIGVTQDEINKAYDLIE
jgi:integrase